MANNKFRKWLQELSFAIMDTNLDYIISGKWRRKMTNEEANIRINKSLEEDNKMREEGRVKWFNDAKGFGFIERPNGKDIFVHYKDIKMIGHKTLEPGEKVTFKPEHIDKGDCAREVERV